MVSEQRYLDASHVHIQAYGYNPSSPTWDSAPTAPRRAFAPLKAMVDEAPLTLDGVSIAVRQMPSSREAELSGFAVIKEIPGVGVTVNGYTVPHIAMPIVLERIHACSLSAVNLSFTPSPVALRERMLGLLRPCFPLRSVRLSIPLSPGEVPAVCDFLRTRARGSEHLELNGHLLPADDVGAIAAALGANGTITRLDLCACRRLAGPDAGCTCEGSLAHETTRAHLAQIADIERRNKRAEARVGSAAIRALVVARVLLHAYGAPEPEPNEHTPTTTATTSPLPRQTEPTPTPPPPGSPFRILDLPPEIMAHILSFCTDSAALTRAQWIKVLRRAHDRGRIAVEARQFARYAAGSSGEMSAALAEWAISGGFWWDHEYAPA